MTRYVIHIVLFMVMFVSAEAVFALGKQDDERMSLKEKREAARENNFKLNKQMLENRNFVLESDFLQNRYGHRISVSRNINFVMVEGDQAVIQIGSYNGLGANGVGGVTAKGKITKWDLNENERNNSFYVKMHVMTAIGIYDVTISVGNQFATARLSGTRPVNLTFSGNLVELKKSVVFEGRSL